MSRPTQATRSRRTVATLIGAAILAAAVPAAVFAKEITSGGTTASTACQPVTSLTYKGDARVGETGLASIAISYGVKPCTNGQAVTVAVEVYEYANPAAVAYADNKAPQSGKFTVFGVKVRTSYVAKVSVFDASTGNLVGSMSIFAAAVPKGV